jgi:hypothetical protein
MHLDMLILMFYSFENLHINSKRNELTDKVYT